MKQKWQQLYESMQRDIGLCIQKQLDPETEIECCFQISRHYWSIVEMDAVTGCFLTTGDETDFYRNIKPLFVSAIEYYNLLYHAALFKPSDRPDELKEFWIREGQRLGRFIQDHSEFYDYYKSGDCSKDDFYFLSGGALVSEEKPLYRDEWVSTLLSLERYQEFVKQQLNGL